MCSVSIAVRSKATSGSLVMRIPSAATRISRTPGLRVRLKAQPNFARLTPAGEQASKRERASVDRELPTPQGAAAQRIPTSGARRERINDGTAADGARGGLVAEDEPVAVECRNWPVEEQLNHLRRT